MALPKEYLDYLATSAKSGGSTGAVVQKPSALKQNAGKVLGGALKVIDQIERPYYGLMNVAKDVANKGDFDPLGSFYRGAITLQDKTEFGDVLGAAGWNPTSTGGKIAKGAVSIVGNIVLDPVTYLTMGAGKAAVVGGKALTKEGSALLLKNLAQETGLAFKSMKDIGKYGAKISTEAYEAAVKTTMKTAFDNPEQFFSRTSLRYFGKEIPKTADTISNIGSKTKSIVSSIFDTKITREVGREGKLVTKSIGEIFQPNYNILHSRNLTDFQKWELLQKMDSMSSAKAWQESKVITETQQMFKGVKPAEREKLTFEVESLLNNTKTVDDIADPKIRDLAVKFEAKMKDLWEKEVKAGIRKSDEPIEKGYVMRVLKKGMYPEERGYNPFKGRKEDAESIADINKAYKEGGKEFSMEADAGKLYAARATKSDGLIMKKQFTDWLEQNKYITKAGDDPSRSVVEIYGKKYETVPEIAREIANIDNALKDPGLQKFWQTYDNVQNTWKLSVTSFWPSFHARNAVSNVFLGWLGGNTDLKTYQTATKLQWYAHQLKAGKNVADEVIKVGNSNYKLSELLELGGTNGVVGTGWLGGDMMNKIVLKENLKNPVKALDLYLNWTKRAGTAVENNARIAMFVDRLAKGDDVVSAATHTKKFLFDYGALSETERTAFRRIAPFYTWMRKNIPLQLEQMVKQPGKYTGLSHTQKGIETMTSAEEDKYLPSWMKSEEMYVRLPGNRYFNPDLPFQDLAKLTLSDRTIKEIVNPITPLLKGVMEIAANKDIFRGKPLADQNLPQDVLAREKIWREIKNNLRFTSVYTKATDDERTLLDKIMNTIFGLNTTTIDPKQSRSMYKQKYQAEQKALLRFKKNQDKAK